MPALLRGISGLDSSLWGNRMRRNVRGAAGRRVGASGKDRHRWDLPEERRHWNPALTQHGADDLSQVEPDVRDVDGHVLCHLQNLPEAARQSGCQTRPVITTFVGQKKVSQK